MHHAHNVRRGKMIEVRKYIKHSHHSFEMVYCRLFTIYILYCTSIGYTSMVHLPLNVFVSVYKMIATHAFRAACRPKLNTIFWGPESETHVFHFSYSYSCVYLLFVLFLIQITVYERIPNTRSSSVSFARHTHTHTYAHARGSSSSSWRRKTYICCVN